MATVTITQLPNSNALTGSEVLPIVQGDVTVQTTVQDIANLGGLSGTNYLYVAADGTDTENATALSASYSTAKTMSPSATNRITIIAAPGYYNFGTSTFTMDTQYIDLVSLDGNRSIIFNATLNESIQIQGSIRITANNIYLKGVDVLTKGIRIAPNLSSLVVENVKGGNYTFFTEEEEGIMQGDFVNCEGGDNSFTAFIQEMSTTFKNCIGGNYSFTSYGDATMIATDCIAGDYSLNTNKGTLNGTFRNCIGGLASLRGGFGMGQTPTIFTNCQGDSQSFGNLSGNTSLYYCKLFNDTFYPEYIEFPGAIVLCINGNNSIETYAPLPPL